MWSSAMASSSPVVTPGRTAARTAAIAPATTSPAPRMSSISCGVLIWIIRPLHFARSGRRPMILSDIPADINRPVPSACVGLPDPVGHAQRLQGAGGDGVDLTDRVDPGQQTLVRVEPGQWRGLFPVHLQAVPDGLGLVVVALDHLAVDQH